MNCKITKVDQIFLRRLFQVVLDCGMFLVYGTEEISLFVRMWIASLCSPVFVPFSLNCGLEGGLIMMLHLGRLSLPLVAKRGVTNKFFSLEDIIST